MQTITNKSLIVCLGHDTELLATRREVLATCYKARSVLGTDLSGALCPGEIVDLLLLCHTLSPTECTAAEALLREHSPGTKILRMLPLLEEAIVGSGVPVVSTSEGPARLLQRINDLLLGAGEDVQFGSNMAREPA